MKTKFIVVDDDYINNELSRMIIENVFPNSSIKTFTNPEIALIFIKLNYADANVLRTLLFLDINMPLLNGWEFLEVFEQFDSVVKQQLEIYMLSSSLDPRDKKRAIDNKNVKGFFEKPLMEESLKIVVSQLEV